MYKRETGHLFIKQVYRPKKERQTDRQTDGKKGKYMREKMSDS